MPTLTARLACCLAVGAASLTNDPIWATSGGQATGTAGADAHPPAVRLVWTLPGSTPPPAGRIGRVSPDGRYVSFVDWDDSPGNLFVHDLTAGHDARLTAGKGREFASGSLFSPDGRHIAYLWFADGAGQIELRTTPLDHPLQSQVLLTRPSVYWIEPYAWSPDGRWIAVEIGGEGMQEIALVSATDGAVRTLKKSAAVDFIADSMAFSPDGVYLAYSTAAPSHRGPLYDDVVVMHLSSGEESTLISGPGDDRLFGWAESGHLLFTTDRTGWTGLWRVPVANGRTTAPAEFLRRLDPNTASMGLTRTGTLFVGLMHRLGPDDIKTAVFDFQTGRLVEPPTDIVESFAGRNRLPRWSPDGRSLAYITAPGTPGQVRRRLVVQGLHTDAPVRTVSLNTTNEYALSWSPLGDALLIDALSGGMGGRGLFLVDLEAERVTTPVQSQDGVTHSGAVWAADGRSVIYRRQVTREGQSSAASIVRRRLGGSDEEVLAAGASLGAPALSPDGLHMATVVANQAGTEHQLDLISLGPGGERRRLLSEQRAAGTRASPFLSLTWTPDSRSMIVRKRLVSPSAPDEVWQVFIDGRAAKLDLTLERNLALVVSAPDARSLLMRASGPSGSEFWHIPLFGGAPARVEGLADVTGVVVHPDGRRVALQMRREHPAIEEVWAIDHVPAGPEK